MARRGRVLLLVTLLAVAASAGGLVATLFVKSPAEQAADTAPPPRSVVTEKVVSRQLATTVVMRGKFANGRQFKFTATAPASTSEGPGGTAMIVTGVHTSVGATVRAGKVLVEVSGRPVYALAGAFPAYRDLAPGMSGKDVAQLQDALGELGYRDADRSGYFGDGTARAVIRFYRDLGYSVPRTATASATPTPAPSASSTPSSTGESLSTVQVPMSEVAFLPTLPARVAAFGAAVGDAATSPLITFTTGGPRLTGHLDPASGPLVKPGMAARVVDEATGFSGSGKVTAVGAQVSSAGASYLPLTIAADGSWPAGEAGQDVRVTITAAATAGKVLAVPESALTADANGNTTVVAVAGGAERIVVVTVGASAGGLVAVAPAPGQHLVAGDEVVTGK